MNVPSARKTKGDDAKKYSAPALEKGLDILELLATRTKPVSQRQIAAELGRSASEVFRMLTCLEERGYIHRNESGGGFALTMRLHNLAHNWPPSKRLLEVALPEMRNLAEQVNQSCHLGIYSSGRLYVAAQADSPLPVMISVRVTGDFSLPGTASGRVLLAFQERKLAEHWIMAANPNLSDAERQVLDERLRVIRRNGFELTESDRVDGMKDVCCPVLDLQGNAIAAIAVPYLTLLSDNTPMDEVKEQLMATARLISDRMGLGEETGAMTRVP